MASVNDLMYFFTSYLGINPAHGCNLGCGYCVLEKDHPVPDKVVKDATANFTLDTILNSDNVTKTNPLAFYNLSDPFLKQNIDDLMFILEGLESHGYQNPVVLITKLNPERVKPDARILQRIAEFKNIKPVIMVTYANVPREIEPVSKSGRLELMARSKELGIAVVQYGRPLWEEWTPMNKVKEMVRETADKVDAVVISGVVVSDAIKAKLKTRNTPIPSWDNNKGRYLDSAYRDRVIHEYKRANPDLGVFINSSCGISAALKIPHYMGYQWHFKRVYNNDYCPRPCSAQQRDICHSAEPPIKCYGDDQKELQEGEKRKVKEWMERFDAKRAMFRIKDGYLNVFARLMGVEVRMMRQHIGMYTYFDANMKDLRDKKEML